MKELLSTILLVIITSTLKAQDPMIEWENNIGGTGRDIISSIQQTTDGGYIIGGTSDSDISMDKSENSIGDEDYWVVKLSASGNIQWENTIGGSFTDELVSIRQTSDGGYIVGGHSDSGISGDKTESNLGFDFWILKLDPVGNIQWQKTLGGLGDQELTSLEIAADGGYILHQGSGLLPELIMKLDPNGNVVHQVNLGRGGVVQETPDGRYLVGTTFPSSFGSEIRLQKVDTTGAILWNKDFTANNNDQLRAFQQLPDGGYIVGARSSSNIWGDKTENNRGPSNTYDYWVIRLDAARNIVWDKTIGGSGDEDLSYIQQTADGGFIIGGHSDSDSTGDKTENAIINPGYEDLWIVKLDALGNIVWQNTIGGNYDDQLNSMDITAAGGYILGSQSSSLASGDKSESRQGFDDYWIVKIRSGIYTNRITGRVYADLNDNCQIDSTDVVFENSLLRIDPGQTYFTTDDSGKYELWVDTGNYSISVLTQNPYYSVDCPASGTYSVNFTSYGNLSSNNDFGLQADVYCPLLKVDIATTRLRRCTNAMFAVQYGNIGSLPSSNTYVNIDFGDYLQPQSSTISWTTVSGNVYTFPLGNLNVNQEGSFRVIALVSCNANANSTQCVTARIYPDTLCVPPSTGWDKSEISVSGTCVNDSLVCFTTKNLSGAGLGDMAGTADWRLYVNDSLVKQGTYQLGGQDSLIQCYPANGKTFRLEADQRPDHPRKSRPIAIVEACGTPKNFGFVNTTTQDDADLYKETFCMLVTEARDPNDKQVSPAGITANKYINSEDELEYLIRFQNTGNDTAFRVVIRDTIQTDVLDIVTLTSGAASHPYTFNIHGHGIAEWTFENILLPDSNVNESESHGFVKFKIQQVPGNPDGTLIENRAAIYFDFNAPIFTNTAWNVINEANMPESFLSANVSTSHVSCNGLTNGESTVIATGGLPPYRYLWSDSSTTKTASSLASGNYTVTVTDATEAVLTDTVSITEPPLMVAAIASKTDILCYANGTGTATVTATGGTEPYSYEWNDAQSSPTASSLNAGTYTVTVTDSNSCMATASVTIVEPSQLNLSFSIQSSVTCLGDNDAAVKADVAGGVAPYNFSWSNGQSTSTANDLTAGSYHLTITDANGCWLVSSVNIQEGYQISIDTITGADTADVNQVTTYSVEAGFDYTWSVAKGTIISGQNSNTVEVEWNTEGQGILEVAVTAQGCSELISKVVSVVSPTGIYDYGMNGLELYPNPTNGTISLKAANIHGQATLKIFDAVGRKVWQQIALQSELEAGVTIDLKEMIEGVCFLNIQSDHGSWVMKVVRY